LSAGIERFLKIDEISKNENLIFSNSKGAYSEALGEVGITSMIYFAYNLYSYTEKMKKKRMVNINKQNIIQKNIINYGIWK